MLLSLFYNKSFFLLFFVILLSLHAKEFEWRVPEMEGQSGRVETFVKFTCTISDFSKLECRKLYSETFFTGCHPWYLQLTPILQWLYIIINKHVAWSLTQFRFVLLICFGFAFRRILIYPKAANTGRGLSIYLDAGDTANFPFGWSRSANLKLSLINQFNGKKTRTRRSIFHNPSLLSMFHFSVFSIVWKLWNCF